jgi:hypothetical protein
MRTIEADFSSIITMAGPVKFYQRPCPHGTKGMFNKVAYVGSSDCQMCPNFGDKKQHLIEGTDLVTEVVDCNYE